MKLSLDSVLAHGEVHLLLGLLKSLSAQVRLGDGTTDGTGLLGAEIQGGVLLSLEVDSQFLALLLRNDSVDTGNVFANLTAKMNK